MFCTNCGKQLPSDAKFCEGCGAKQEPQVQANPIPVQSIAPVAEQPSLQSQAPPKKKNNTAIIAILLLGTVVAAGWHFDVLSIINSGTAEETSEAEVTATNTNIPASVSTQAPAPMPAVSAPIPQAVVPQPVQTSAPPAPAAPVAAPTPPPAPTLNPPPYAWPGYNVYRREANNVMTGDTVNLLYQALSDIHLRLDIRMPSLTNVGGFHGGMMGAVVDFQLQKGLPRTGVVDQATWYEIMTAWVNPPETPAVRMLPAINSWYVLLSNLHLRAQPSSTAASLEVVDQDTFVWVIDYLPDVGWFRVQHNNQVGYMHAGFMLREGVLH